MHDGNGKAKKLVVAVRKLIAPTNVNKQAESVRVAKISTVVVTDSKQNGMTARLKLPNAGRSRQTTFTFDHAFESTVDPKQVQFCTEVGLRAVLKFADWAYHKRQQNCLPALPVKGAVKERRRNSKQHHIVCLACSQPTAEVAFRCTYPVIQVANAHLSLWLTWSEYESLNGESMLDVLSDRNELALLREKNDSVRTDAALSEKQIGSVGMIEQVFEENIDCTQLHYSLLELTVKNGDNMHGKVSFWEIPLPEVSKQGRNSTECERIFLLGDATRDMNQGRVRIQEAKANRLGQLLKQQFKKIDRTLAMVNMDPTSKLLQQTLTAFQAIMKQPQPPMTQRAAKQEQPARLKGVLPQHRTNILIEEEAEQVTHTRKTVDPKKNLQLGTYSKTMKMSLRPNTLRLFPAKPSYRAAGVKPSRQNSQLKETVRIRNKTLCEMSELPFRMNNSNSNTNRQLDNLAKMLRTEEDYVKQSEQSTWGGDTQPLIHQYCKTEELVGEDTQQPYFTSRQQEAYNESSEHSIEHLLPYEPELCQSIYKTTVEPVLEDDMILPSTFSNQFEWSKLVRQFSEWEFEKSKGCQYFGQAGQYLAERLRQQKDALTWLHNQCIGKEVETIKGQVELVNRLKQNRGDCDPLVYMDTIELAIEIKLEGLLKLKQQTATFRQHSMELRCCQQKLQQARNQQQQQCPFEDLLDSEESLL